MKRWSAGARKTPIATGPAIHSCPCARLTSERQSSPPRVLENPAEEDAAKGEGATPVTTRVPPTRLRQRPRTPPDPSPLRWAFYNYYMHSADWSAYALLREPHPAWRCVRSPAVPHPLLWYLDGDGPRARRLPNEREEYRPGDRTHHPVSHDPSPLPQTRSHARQDHHRIGHGGAKHYRYPGGLPHQSSGGDPSTLITEGPRLLAPPHSASSHPVSPSSRRTISRACGSRHIGLTYCSFIVTWSCTFHTYFTLHSQEHLIYWAKKRFNCMHIREDQCILRRTKTLVLHTFVYEYIHYLYAGWQY